AFATCVTVYDLLDIFCLRPAHASGDIVAEIRAIRQGPDQQRYVILSVLKDLLHLFGHGLDPVECSLGDRESLVSRAPVNDKLLPIPPCGALEERQFVLSVGLLGNHQDSEPLAIEKLQIHPPLLASLQLGDCHLLALRADYRGARKVFRKSITWICSSPLSLLKFSRERLA